VYVSHVVRTSGFRTVERGFQSHGLEIAIIIHLVVAVNMPELLRHLTYNNILVTAGAIRTQNCLLDRSPVYWLAA
jgi:hypothetical protein